MWQWVLIAASVGFFLWTIRAKRTFQPTIHNPKEFWPFFGSTFAVLRSVDDHHHDWKTRMMQSAARDGKVIACWPMVASPAYFEVGAPKMVEFMLKTNFDNFVKGPQFQAIFMEMLGGGIFNSDGDSWRTQRKTASHMFSSRQLNEYMLDVFKHESQLLLQHLAQVKEFDVIEMQSMFYRFTLDSICTIAFGVHINSLGSADQQQPAFATSFDAAQEISALRWMGPPIVWKVKRALGLGCERNMPEHMRIINEFVFGVVRQRRANLDQFEGSGDMLSLFLQDAKKRGEDLTDQELRDVIMNFLIAGRDTTASCLTYMFRALSDFPAIEAKVCDELHAVLGEEGEVDEANIKQLKYLEAVVLETTRLYSPVASDVKLCVRECTFPDGTVMPAGAAIGYSPYVLARLEAHWGADASSFNPDRWLDEDGNLKQPSQYQFPSFNAGPRLCLGKSMAIQEAKTLAATILQKYALRVAPGANTDYRLTVVLAMKHGLPMTVKPRNSCY